jgi:TrmH family RNA methyltransferase
MLAGRVAARNAADKLRYGSQPTCRVPACFNRAALSESARPSRFVRRRSEDPTTRRDESLAFLATEATWQPPEWFSNIAVVLVETTDAVNVGGVVRVMANTGFLELRLVRPVNFDPWHVAGIAHYTQHIVDAATRFDSLEAAVGDRHFVLGFTGIHHRVERNALTLESAIDAVVSAARESQPVALVFGREDYGLTNTMLDHCHAVTTIPTNPAYPSLNLAQAALLVLYQVFQRAGGQAQTYRPPHRPAPPATARLLEDLFADLERALEAIGFLSKRSRASTMRSLRVALFRARLDTREASLMRAAAIEVRKFLRRKGVISEIGPVGYAQGSDAEQDPR